MPDIRLRAEGSLIIDTKTDQVEMPDILATDNGSRDYLALAICRIDQQWRRDFESTVPREFLSIVEPFKRNPVAMLRLLTVCPDAEELAHSNPALFYEVASHFDQAKTMPELKPHILSLLRRPQTEILAMRGLLATNCARQFFAKMSPADVCSSRLKIFSHALKSRQISRWLTHLQPDRHTAKLLSVSSVWSYLTPQLVMNLNHFPKCERELAYLPKFPEWKRNWDIEDALRRLKWFHRQVQKGEKARRFRSLGELRKLNVPSADRAAYEFGPRREIVSFPPPPIAGTSMISPLTYPSQLRDEAEIMENCAASPSHMTGCADGRMYFYRLLSPQRCTVRIEKSEKRNGWLITEIRAQGNATVGFGTIQAVCDSLRIPARPEWFKHESWWSDEPECECSPRKESAECATYSTWQI